MSTILRALSVSLLTLVAACLEGDPNTVGQPGSLTGSSGSSGTSGSSATPPVVQPNACSGTNSTAVTLSFTNQTDRQLRVFWVNQKCTEIDYGPLEAGTNKLQPTFIGHVWRVRDGATGALYKEFMASAAGSAAVTIP